MSLSVNFRGTANNVTAPAVESKKESELQNEVELEEKSSKKGKVALLCTSLAALAATGAYMVLRKKPVPPRTPSFFEECKMVDGKLISPIGMPYSGTIREGNYESFYDNGILRCVENIKDKTVRGMCFDEYGNKQITKRNYKNHIETNVVIKRRENGTLEYCRVQRRDLANKDKFGIFEQNHLGDGYLATYDETGKLTSKRIISLAEDKANNNWTDLGTLESGRW